MDEFFKILNSLKTQLETDKLAGISELTMAAADGACTADKGKDLGGLAQNALDCKACQLHKRRTNLVFGAGSPGAKLMFVGEAPGHDEDIKGLPFVGRAGELLTKMIEAMGIRREDVYIANVLKCRPPNNRSPMPDEITACTCFLSEQIRIIKPAVICALGKFAAQFILKSEQPISSLRGKFYHFNDTKVMPTFHPAYLLRNPNDKRLVWEDLKKIRDEIKK